MQLIDTHCHLYAEEFIDDLEQVLKRAQEAGVQDILLPNIDVASIQPMLDLAQNKILRLHPAMGLHPCYVKPDTWEKDLSIIEQYLFDPSYSWCAVGEIGLDLYWDKSTLDIQKKAFKQQLLWAQTLKLPVMIHARESLDQIFEVIDEVYTADLKGVFHCFTGTEAQAIKIMSYQAFSLGIGGVLTYKNSSLSQVLKNIPLEKLILETDAPYLPPTPHRGKRNEPSYVRLVAEHLATIYQKSMDEIAQKTTQNAQILFSL